MASSWSRLQFILAGVLAAALILVIGLLADKPLGEPMSTYIGKEQYKFLLQFVLVTIIGGGVFALFALMKEEQTRRDARLKSIQAVEKEMAEVYRTMKQCKRRLRSRLIPGERNLKVPIDDFRKSMDELLAVQIRIEGLEDDIVTKFDLLDNSRISRLAQLFDYSASCLHDVYEDFEKGRVQVDGKNYIIGMDDKNSGGNCSSLVDFIDMPERIPKPAALPENVKDVLGKMKKMRKSIAEQAETLDGLNSILKDIPSKPRFTDVAYECFRIATVEVRQAAQDTIRAQT
jgi:hypothetical protein